ncbi:TPA: hypothetical protein TXJ16_001478 [Streptococcus suis]|nr:hypothetical protein [Streptococcus suis]
MNLVKADWYRIRKERLSLVSLAILIVLSLILAYSSSKDLEVTGAQDILSNWTNLLPLFFVAPAKIFFGEDFQFRTVNNSLVRTQNRLKIFTHKWLSSVGLCVFYVLFAYMLTGFARQMMNGAADYGVLLEGFVYQLPFYIVIASFCTILFVVFPKIYQSYMVYILIAFLFDQLFIMATGILLKTDFFADFMMFSQLSVAAGTKSLLSLPSILAFVFSVVYVSCGTLLFSKKELK